MAKRKRTKKEAKERLPRLPTVPPTAVPLLGPLAGPYALGKSVEIVADKLIDIDPLNRLAEETPVQRLAKVVNDPAIMVDEPMMQVINDPSLMMASNGEILVRTNPTASARAPMDTGDFARAFARRATDIPKRKRKKNPKLAAAFREANARYRTKSGKLRKGRTQADIAKLAHRLLKRM